MLKDLRKEPKPHSSPIYKNLAPAYQAVWPAVARKRTFDAIRSMRIPSRSRVLEVGVGTGMSLEGYPSNIDFTGVDLSEEMLAEARHFAADRGLGHVDLMPMNAEDLAFEDSSFDFVTSFHTISVVSDPQAMMSEIVRVCRPGGQVMIINHFRSDNPIIARVVDTACGLTKRLGWRTDLELGEVLSELPLRLDHCSKPNPFSLFTVMKATRRADEQLAVGG